MSLPAIVLAAAATIGVDIYAVDLLLSGVDLAYSLRGGRLLCSLCWSAHTLHACTPHTILVSSSNGASDIPGANVHRERPVPHYDAGLASDLPCSSRR